MPVDARKLIRTIVRRVHPDLFGSHPAERTTNSESLKILNSYVDELSRGNEVETFHVEFFVEEDGSGLNHIVAELPSYGSLGPLFFAFGLITAEDLSRGVGTYYGDDTMDTDFLEWLGKTVGEALITAEQHESLKGQVRELRAAVENRFRLIAIQVGGEYAVTTLEQKRQIEALRSLEATLGDLSTSQGLSVEGLSIRLYHPEAAPSQSHVTEDKFGNVHVRTEVIKSYVAEDGVYHMVAKPEVIEEALLAEEELEKARVLSKTSWVWSERIKQLVPRLRELLRVEDVWCDTGSAESAAEFVAWAGRTLTAATEFRQLANRSFSFSLLVHTDATAPSIDFMVQSSVLQMRADCPTADLLGYLLSEAVAAANSQAQDFASLCQQEEQLLDNVRKALGARHVIRVCSSREQQQVLGAGQRLLDNAAVIRSAVDLSGVSIAIDDCYELWESGFISIPFNFQLQELEREVQRLLGVPGSYIGESKSNGVHVGQDDPVAITYEGEAYYGDGGESGSDWPASALGLGGQQSTATWAKAGQLRAKRPARLRPVTLPHRRMMSHQIGFRTVHSLF